MKKAIGILAALLVAAATSWPLPSVDGKVSQGEYPRSVSLVYGDVTVSYQADASAGLFLAVSAPTTGWVGIGLGSVVMDGAHIFMGYVKDGQPVISEQTGQGHSHTPSAEAWADAAAVTQRTGITTLELHVPASKVPAAGKTLGFIVAFSGSADLTTFHDDNHDGGYMDLSPP